MNIIKKLNRNRWDLAFFEKNDLNNVLAGDYSNVHWMKYCDKSRWFADPFILEVTDDYIIVLVEELSYDLNRGRLAKLTVNRKTWKMDECKIILDLTTHLSFPMIIRRGDEVIVIPENSASGCSIAYRYNLSNDTLEKLAKVSNDALTDAVSFDLNGKSYLFATKQPAPNGNQLSIYSFDKSELKASLLSTVTFDKPIARNAGKPFEYNGKLVRPAQDCDGAYGKGVIIQEIVYNSDNDSFGFNELGSIYPFNFKYNLGVHTLNVHAGMCVIDGRGLLHPYWGRIVRPVINLVRR
jgi:hypothetical protein